MFGRWHISYPCLILVWIILLVEPLVEGQQLDAASGHQGGHLAKEAEPDLVYPQHQHLRRDRRNSPNTNPFVRLRRRQTDADSSLILRRHRRQSLHDQGFIVKLYVECPATATAGGRFVLKADVPACGYARCKNGRLPFDTSTRPIYTLAINFSTPTDPNQCQFYKHANVDVYTVMVEIGWGGEADHCSAIMPYNRQEQVTCNYDSYANTSSVLHQLNDFIIAPKENLNMLGAASASSFSLSVMNVLGTSIDNWDFNIGRMIRLKATVGTGQIAGMRALTCDARNSDGDSYAILRGGCGDGVIFPKDVGFTTELGGNTVYSPYFTSFKLCAGMDLRFECTFVVCTSACNGNSCITD